MYRHAVNRRQFDHNLVQSQVALLYQPRPHPIVIWGKLALASPTPRADVQAPALALQDHHVVHKARRNPEVTRSVTMAMTLFDKSNDPTADLNRMCFDHSQPPASGGIRQSQTCKHGNPESVQTRHALGVALKQPCLFGGHRGLGAVVDADLAVKRFHVQLDRRFLNAKVAGDFLVGLACAQALQHLQFAG